MYSADFFKRYKKLLHEAQQKQIASGDITVATGPATEGVRRSVGTRIPHWAQSGAVDVETIVYDVLTGKAYPNPNEARKSGVVNFSYQIPSGMNIDWSWWDKFKTPEPELPPASEITVADQTVPFSAPAPITPTPVTAPPSEAPGPAAPEPAAPEPAAPEPAAPAPAAPEPAAPEPAAPEPAVTLSAKVVSYDDWVNQGTYMHGNIHGEKGTGSAGKSLKGDKNNPAYYQNYVKEMNKALTDKNHAYAREINRAHSLDSGND